MKWKSAIFHGQENSYSYAGVQPRFQSWGVQFLGLGYYYPSKKKIRQVYPVWCSRLHNHSLFIKKLCKKLLVRPNFGEVRTPDPPLVAPMQLWATSVLQMSRLSPLPQTRQPDPLSDEVWNHSDSVVLVRLSEAWILNIPMYFWARLCGFLTDNFYKQERVCRVTDERVTAGYETESTSSSR